MAGYCETLQSNSKKKSSDDYEDVNKILAVVVQRRKTFPTKWMQVNSEITALELQRLENAKIITEDYNEKEEFRRIVQEFNSQNLKSLSFKLDDLYKAQNKLEKLYGRMKDIKSYLKKREQFVK